VRFNDDEAEVLVMVHKENVDNEILEIMSVCTDGRCYLCASTCETHFWLFSLCISAPVLYVDEVFTPSPKLFDVYEFVGSGDEAPAKEPAPLPSPIVIPSVPVSPVGSDRAVPIKSPLMVDCALDTGKLTMP